MSVQAMKLVTITGPVEALDQVARSCVVDRPIHLEAALPAGRHNRVLRPVDTANPGRPCCGRLTA